MAADIADLARPDRRRIGVLVNFAVDQLWYNSPDSLDDDDHLGCCPVCCAPCGVLAALYRAGELDRWLALSPLKPEKCFYWDAAAGRLDRRWLLRSWRNCERLECHTERPMASRQVASLLASLERDVDSTSDSAQPEVALERGIPADGELRLA